jgi:hypothetical protein
VKLRDVRSGRKLDAEWRRIRRLTIKLRELLPNFGGFDADNCVIGCVVIDRAAEHLGADHALAKRVVAASESVLDDQEEKIL